MELGSVRILCRVLSRIRSHCTGSRMNRSRMIRLGSLPSTRFINSCRILYRNLNRHFKQTSYLRRKNRRTLKSLSASRFIDNSTVHSCRIAPIFHEHILLDAYRTQSCHGGKNFHRRDDPVLFYDLVHNCTRIVRLMILTKRANMNHTVLPGFHPRKR